MTLTTYRLEVGVASLLRRSSDSSDWSTEACRWRRTWAAALKEVVPAAVDPKVVAPTAAEDVPRAACREQSDVVASEACQPTDAAAPLARSEGEAAYRAPCPAAGEAACQRADSGAVNLRSLRGRKMTDSRINTTGAFQ